MNKLEMFETSPGFYTVIVDGKFADMLTKDEALGTVASALFGSGRPLFTKTYEEWLLFNKRLSHRTQEPVALLTLKTGGSQ